MTQPPIGPTGYDESPEDEVGLLLSDARERAQTIIDESITRAQELLRAQPSSQALERIRRTVSDLAVDVRAVHSRLDEIEALIRGGAVTYRAPAIEAHTAPPAYAPAPAPAAAYPAQPPYAPPPEPQAPVYRAPEPTYTPPAAPVPPIEVAPAPPAAPASAVPPRMPPPAPQAPPPPPPPPPVTEPPAPMPQQPPPAVEPVSAPRPADVPAPMPAPRVGFDPGAGSVALRIAPVAGFQGLMRVQDALARCRGIREAGVEAYAQGEARLRLQFSEPLDGSQLAASLAETLGRGVRLIAESTSDRTVQLALE